MLMYPHTIHVQTLQFSAITIPDVCTISINIPPLTQSSVKYILLRSYTSSSFTILQHHPVSKRCNCARKRREFRPVNAIIVNETWYLSISHMQIVHRSKYVFNVDVISLAVHKECQLWVVQVVAILNISKVNVRIFSWPPLMGVMHVVQLFPIIYHHLSMDHLTI